MTTDKKSNYFQELRRNLQREGVVVCPEAEDLLTVELDGQRLCQITGNGGVRDGTGLYQGNYYGPGSGGESESLQPERIGIEFYGVQRGLRNDVLLKSYPYEAVSLKKGSV